MNYVLYRDSGINWLWKNFYLEEGMRVLYWGDEDSLPWFEKKGISVVTKGPGKFDIVISSMYLNTLTPEEEFNSIIEARYLAPLQAHVLLGEDPIMDQVVESFGNPTVQESWREFSRDLIKCDLEDFCKHGVELEEIYLRISHPSELDLVYSTPEWCVYV